jgi:Zn-dependent peptidase ImmA (M78 family)
MLLTDARRSRGAILVNTAGGLRRARFSIAHELGHFLMERHVLGDERGFACSMSDMRTDSGDTLHRKQEAEANQFAISLLAPAHGLRICLSGDPNLRSLQALSDELDLSREATIRRYVDLCDQPVAAIWTKDGKIRTMKRHDDFPWITRRKGDKLSELTEAWRAICNLRQGFTEMKESATAAWTNADAVTVYEQTRVGKEGHAVTLLWADLPDEASGEEDGPSELGMPGFRNQRRRD